MSPELAWLLSMLGPAPATGGRQALDTARLIDLAAGHGLARRLAARAEFLEPEQRARLQAEARRRITAELGMRGNLQRILAAFHAADLAVIPFKGPVLADLLYDTDSGRAFNDLDLLVRPNDVARAISVLKELNYKPTVDVANPSENPVLKFAGEMVLRSKALRSQVDLHWTLLGWSVRGSERMDGVWQRAVHQRWRDQPILTLSPTDLAEYLCCHGSKHLWLHLKHLDDLSRLFQSELAVDWDLLLDEAVEAGRTRLFLLGPFLAYRLLSTRIPDTLRHSAEKDRQLALIADYVVASLDSPKDWQVHLRNRSVWAKLLNSRRAMVRHLMIESLGPSVADWQSVKLPEQLSFLYYAYRPLRLTGVRLRRFWAGFTPV